jgi:phosphatidylserine decarboxylase
LGFDDISLIEGIFVKGEKFSLATLLQDQKLAERFHRGAMVLSRLCPVDYHRFHFPVSGVPDQPRVIRGPLFSVSPIALKRNIHILALNRRALCRLESPTFGLVLMLEVGATNVGSFEYTFQPGDPVEKGAEKGYFKFGGSLIITLFEAERVQLATDLIETSRQGIELYARVGDEMGRHISKRA